MEPAEVVSGGLQLAVQELTNLQLQLCVGLLQGADLDQVGGQTVVQVLHGGLLVCRHGESIRQGEAATTASPEASSSAHAVTTSTPGREGRAGAGDAHPGATGTSVHAAGPHAPNADAAFAPTRHGETRGAHGGSGGRSEAAAGEGGHVDGGWCLSVCLL